MKAVSNSDDSHDAMISMISDRPSEIILQPP